ncbi:MAG: S9 family peptidase, partial [Halanaeroarchaeum sp.]
MTDDSDTDVLEALASLPSFHHPTVSPDGDEIAYYYDGTGRNELHVVDVETGETTRWSDGEVPRNARWFVEWDADGDRVFFHLDEGGNEQNDVYAIDLDGAVEQVVGLDGQCALQDVSDDHLLFTSDADEQMNLYRCALDGSGVEKLTAYERPVLIAAFSPDGDRVAYATNESEDRENRDTYVADADGSNSRKLPVGAQGSEVYPASFGPEGDRPLVSDNTEDLGRCGVYDFRDDEVTWYGSGDYEEKA